MPNKTLMGYYCTLARKTKIKFFKKLAVSDSGEDVELLELSRVLVVELGQPLEKSLEISYKSK